ncbi:MAG: hypothetical protein VX529_06550, partial [Pseudomonadota bacterium]|nr:hypothetical protein [Pseudomonadota bacterium]
MTEARFTPGPWDVLARIQPAKHPTSENPYECVYRIKGDLSHGQSPDLTDEGAPVFSSEEQRANAHLIAASPDLYEALEWLIKQIDEQCVCLEWGSPPSTLAEIIESRVDG